MKRFTDNAKCAYDLAQFPAGAECRRIDYVNGEKTPEGKLVWCSDQPAPAIGDTVTIRFNGLGSGVVESYFHEHGHVGVCVKLAQVPDWKRKQQKKNADVALVFPAEIGL